MRTRGRSGQEGSVELDDERAFLSAYDPARYPRPSVAVDVALLAAQDGGLVTLTVRRREPPYRGWVALPGGFVGLGESLEAAAARVLARKARLSRVYLEQLHAFGAPGRDPRARVISVAYTALVDPARLARAAAASLGQVEVVRLRVPWLGEEGGAVQVLDAGGVPRRLAFDHASILGVAVARLRSLVRHAPVGFALLPERFTLLELQRVHEAVLGRALDKNGFRRRMLASGWLVPTGQGQTAVGHRPAGLFRVRPGGQAP